MQNSDNFPPITHEVEDKELLNLLNLPDAKYVEIRGLQGISQLQAFKMQPIFTSIENKQTFAGWKEVGDFQFKLMFSPNRKVIRMELYDPNMFAILIEQLTDLGYTVLSSGEDVEFTYNNPAGGGWLGWAHLTKF